MEKFILPRVELPTETLGSIYTLKNELICKTMELVWRNNKIGKTADTASCIPYGIHIFEKMPPNEGRDYGHFRCRQVPGRNINKNFLDMNGLPMSSILMHRITYVKDLLGCLGIGSRFNDLNKDGVPDIEGSSKKLQWMYENMPKVFELEIIKKL